MKIFLLICLISLICLIPSPVSAAEKFSVDQDVVYKVSEDGNTKVTQNVHIRNLTTETLAKEFLLKLPAKNIQSFQAFDQSGLLPVKQTSIPAGTELHILFRKLAPGVNQTFHWTFSYEISGLAKKVGRLWKISLPPVIKTTGSNITSVGLFVPDTFGRLVLGKPAPNVNPSVWSGPGSERPILAVFGTDPEHAYQSYDFNLRYHLANTSFFGQNLEIALPPDTGYQKVFLDTITPKPENVRIDADGNWLAGFPLSAKESLNVRVTGRAAVFAKSTITTGNTVLPKSNLVSLPFWETTSPEIQKTAASLKSPKTIYTFVIKQLTYDKSKPENNPTRLGAAASLKSPLSAICTEFTDLFIALARSAGIQAREVNGFAYTQDRKNFPVSLEKDILHAWPEYYDQNTNKWLMIDPTWEETSGGVDYFHSFDFDHLTLAIHGANSSRPYPAGFYKQKGKLKKFITAQEPQKDVYVVPVNRNLPIISSGRLTIKKQNSISFFGLFSSKTEVIIKNTGATASSPQIVTINNKLLKIPTIPPFGEHKVIL